MLILLAFLSGCETVPSDSRIGHFTAASTFNIAGHDKVAAATAVHGKDCVGYGLEPNDARVQRAMDDAISSGRAKVPAGNMLVNVRIDHTYPRKKIDLIKAIGLSVYALEDCIEVRGDLVSLPE